MSNDAHTSSLNSQRIERMLAHLWEVRGTDAARAHSRGSAASPDHLLVGLRSDPEAASPNLP